MTKGGFDGAEHKFKTRYTHINPKKGEIMVDKLSPVVVMKKIKLGPLDASGLKTVTDFLPELTEADENQDLESQRVTNQTRPGQHEEVSFINTVTQEELNDHVQQCLEMSLENKINQKNAFALKLIDCFSFLQKKKDFSAMACTLDAGTKIYSCRVDALHQQVVKLADKVVTSIAEKKTGVKEGKDDDDLTTGKKFKKARKNKFIASSETLNRTMKTKDPKDKYLRLEALPGAILSAARRDGNDLSLSLERYTPFWPNWENYKPLKAEGMVSLPNIKIFREKSQIGTAETLQKFLEPDKHTTVVQPSSDDGNDDDHMSQETSCSQELVPVDDIPAMEWQNNNDEDNNSFTYDNMEENINTSRLGEGEANVVTTVMDRLQQEAETDGAVNRAPTRVDALKILFDLSSEYNYLQTKNCNYWAGPEFWKRPQGIAENDKEKIKVTNKKKEPAEIVYEVEDMEERLLKLRKGATCLTERTIRSWQKKKTTLPLDLNVDSSWFLNLFHVDNCGARSKEPENVYSKPTSFVDVLENVGKGEDITENSTDPLSPDHDDSRSSQDPMNATFYEAASGQSVNSDEPRDPLNCTFYDAGPSIKESGKIIRVEVSTSINSDFGESSMVPLPKIVNVDPIKYSTRPIRVDMQHLKNAMLDVIREEMENDAQEKAIQRGLQDEGSAAQKPEVKFRKVLKSLPKKLERRTREDLSTAIAFTAVLSLTNEHSLQLEKCDDGDFVVRLPDFPVPTFQESPGAEPNYL